MKKTIFAAISLLAVASSANALAATETLSVGYAQSNASINGDDLGDSAKGVNVKFRHEFDGDWGLIGSYSHTGIEYNYHYRNSEIGKADLKYDSLLLGPSYRFNDYISMYGLVGVANGSADLTIYNSHADDSDTAFAVGAGFQFNPIPSIAIDASYEYTKINETKVGTWMVGAGYRF